MATTYRSTRHIHCPMTFYKSIHFVCYELGYCVLCVALVCIGRHLSRPQFTTQHEQQSWLGDFIAILRIQIMTIFDPSKLCLKRSVKLLRKTSIYTPWIALALVTISHFVSIANTKVLHGTRNQIVPRRPIHGTKNTYHLQVSWPTLRLTNYQSNNWNCVKILSWNCIICHLF